MLPEGVARHWKMKLCLGFQTSIPVSSPASVSASAASVPVDDPFASTNNGAPLVLDMSNIPNPDDFDEGAVW